jgi:uncharacterized protein (TIGR02147 family)
VLEGITLAASWGDPKALQKRLRITSSEFKGAIATLSRAGLIEEIEGKWQKRDQHLYLAGGRSRAEIRAFHEMMIKKALEELKLKTAQEDYERRLINGFTFALNPEHIERLKGKIITFLDELAQEASEGECADVYQCNLQLFPLTSREK